MEVKVGRCEVDAGGNIVVLERDFYGQGMIFKDEEAFYKSEDKPCYVPELSDTVYTRKDFLRLCNEQDSIAEMVFGAVDWQHPESFLDEQYAEGELATCKNCKKIFESYDVKTCPHCGAELKEEQ